KAKRPMLRPSAAAMAADMLGLPLIIGSQFLLQDLYVIGLGSNLGDRHAYLERAWQLVEGRLGSVLKASPWYETQPLGAADQLFLNGALLCAADLAPEPMLAGLLAIEADLGRVRRERWGNRVIDLDLLL